MGAYHLRLFPNRQKLMALSQPILREEGRIEARFQPVERLQKVRERPQEYYLPRLLVQIQDLERTVGLFLPFRTPSLQIEPREDGPAKTQTPCQSTQRTPLSFLWNHV